MGGEAVPSDEFTGTPRASDRRRDTEPKPHSAEQSSPPLGSGSGWWAEMPAGSQRGWVAPKPPGDSAGLSGSQPK